MSWLRAMGLYPGVHGECDPTRRRVLGLLKRFGREATSFQVLEPGLRYWFDGEDACVAYVEVRRGWVTAGEPLCAIERSAEVAARFTRAAAARGRRARFFHVSEAFVARAGLLSTHVGEEPIWNPADWERTVRSSRTLREQLRRARAKGVRVRAVDPSEIAAPGAPLRVACEALVARWLAARRMHEMRFMVRVHPFSFPDQRRYVVAERAGALVGFAAAVPVYRRRGWFIEDLLRDPAAPNGTVELLVDAMLRQFAHEGCDFATLGLAPLAGDVGALLALTRDYTARLYNFAGVRAFKEKLRPAAWEPVYLAFPKGEMGFSAMGDVLAAFAPGGIFRFALHTLVHQRSVATSLLAALLVPWTAMLASMDTARWFPSRAVQTAWVGFNLLLIASMTSLVKKWRNRVAALMAVLTSLDALLTTLQVLLWNVWTARGWADWTGIVLACTGPLLASLFFWSTRRIALSGSHPTL